MNEKICKIMRKKMREMGGNAFKHGGKCGGKVHRIIVESWQ